MEIFKDTCRLIFQICYLTNLSPYRRFPGCGWYKNFLAFGSQIDPVSASHRLCYYVFFYFFFAKYVAFYFDTSNLNMFYALDTWLKQLISLLREYPLFIFFSSLFFCCISYDKYWVLDVAVSSIPPIPPLTRWRERKKWFLVVLTLSLLMCFLRCCDAAELREN